MANKIVLKKSSVASKVPLATDLEVGELAVNLTDQKLYSKKPDGTVVLVGNGITGAGDVFGANSSTDNALARYNGTTGKIIQNSTVTLDDNGTLDNVNAISLDTTPTTPPTTAGTIYWDAGNGTPSVVLNASTELQLGQENIAKVYNGSGATIPNGAVVAVNGAQGQRPRVTLADADTEGLSAPTLGIATESIANGAEGFICTFGLVRGLDTSAFTEGLPIYLSQTAGQFTQTRPSAPAHTVALGWVIKVNASSGEVFVNINNGWELDELHNVLITSPSSGNTLIYDAVANVWKNANITAGTGISVTNGAGSITVNNTGVTSVSGTGTVNGLTLSGTVTTTGSLTLGGTLSNVNLASQVTGTLPVANGGTGLTTYTTGDLLFASSATTLGKLQDVPTGSALISGGTGVAPVWGKITLQTHVDGILPVANGGTGNTANQAASLVNSVTFNDIGTGAPSGSMFNGSLPRIISYNTIGAYPATNPNGYTSNTGTVTSVGGTGTVNGLTLTGTVTTSGNLTLGGTLSGIANSALTNSSVTINGSTVSLGGSTTVTANTTNALTFNNGGAGAASGTTFNGGAAQTISYNTIGAPSTTGTNASGTWGISVTGSAGSALSSPLLSALGNYVWTASTLPTSYNAGIQASFVNPSDGWPNYGSVITARTYSGGGGSLQMYVPYGPGNGGTGLQVRFGNYDVSSGNSWTAWKTLLASDNFNSYAPTLTGGGASGTWGINITGNATTVGSVGITNIVSGNNGAAASDTVSNMNDLAQKSGFYLYNNPSNAPEATWNTWMSAMGHYPGDRYGWQITQAYWSDALWTRRLTNNTWQAWRKILDSGNYNSYAPTLAGGGAYGTWGINVTGSAGGVAWGNVSSKPANIMFYEGFTLDANTMSTNATGFTYSVNAPYTGPIMRFGAGSYDTQFNTTYGGTRLAYRNRNGDIGAWYPWSVVTTYGSYPGGDLYAARFYDGENSAYYCDPNGRSIFASLRLNTNEWMTDSLGFERIKFTQGDGTMVRGYTGTWYIQLGSSSTTTTIVEGAGNFYTTGAVTAYWSDKRLKKNIEKINDWREILGKINGYRFEWNDLGLKILGDSGDQERGVKVGVIAQEAKEALPQSAVVQLLQYENKVDGVLIPKKDIDYDPENPYLTVQLEKYIPVLIEASKGLMDENEQLKATIQSLFGRITALEQKGV